MKNLFQLLRERGLQNAVLHQNCNGLTLSEYQLILSGDHKPLIKSGRPSKKSVRAAIQNVKYDFKSRIGAAVNKFHNRVNTTIKQVEEAISIRENIREGYTGPNREILNSELFDLENDLIWLKAERMAMNYFDISGLPPAEYLRSWSERYNAVNKTYINIETISLPEFADLFSKWAIAVDTSQLFPWD